MLPLVYSFKFEKYNHQELITLSFYEYICFNDLLRLMASLICIPLMLLVMKTYYHIWRKPIEISIQLYY